jgi:hypothetical protein
MFLNLLHVISPVLPKFEFSEQLLTTGSGKKEKVHKYQPSLSATVHFLRDLTQDQMNGFFSVLEVFMLQLDLVSSARLLIRYKVVRGALYLRVSHFKEAQNNTDLIKSSLLGAPSLGVEDYVLIKIYPKNFVFLPRNYLNCYEVWIRDYLRTLFFVDVAEDEKGLLDLFAEYYTYYE